MSIPNQSCKGGSIMIEITGKCRHNIYFNNDDPCTRCAFCTIDGNDYSDFRQGKPSICDD
ncbi:uncharacterized protein YcbX [Desulfitispora alkaliphila]|uniref:hypothetical protein n=1 Tax=Desulfitispora alkaliphila TaxID=622674 RepID=UPI003D1B0DFD